MENKKRMKRMLYAHKSGKTLNQIGVDEGVTRERIRQLISGLPGYKKIKIANKSLRHERNMVEIICGICKKKTLFISSLAKARVKRNSLCSVECYNKRNEETRKDKIQNGIVCSKCNIHKPHNQFYERVMKGKRGITYYISMRCCKKCHAKIITQWKRDNPKRAKIIDKRATANYKARLKPNAIRKYEEALRKDPSLKKLLKELLDNM